MPSDTTSAPASHGERLTFGMLYYSPDKNKPLEERIREAVSYYRDKYDQEATIVALNPKTLQGRDAFVLGDLEIVKSGAVQPDHFWIGQFEGKVSG